MPDIHIVCDYPHSPAHAGGTRFTYDHTGFTGAGGFLLAKLLGSVRKKMLTVGLPAVLDNLDETGALTGRRRERS
jgi:hypothetical protein